MTYKNFCTIYPNYLDSEKSVKLGRRISAKDAVPEPTIQDIHEALASLDIRHVIQPHKGYSRDGPSRWDNPGRVLVDLDGAISTGVLEMSINGGYDMDDAIPEMGVDDENDDHDQTIEGRKGRGKKQLLRQLAQVMSGLPNRQNRLNEKRKLLEEEQLKAAKTEKDATSTVGETGGASGNRKKKGKKKK
jgi:signal recognition particle subunit SRP19